VALELPGWLDPSRVVRLAEQRGAGEAEVYITVARRVEVDMKAGRVERSTVSLDLAVGVRVAVDGRVAGAGGHIADWRGVEEAVEAAIASARSLPRDPHWPGFNPTVSSAGAAVGGLYHGDTASAGPEELAGLLAEAASRVSEAGAGVSEASIAAGEELVVYANSHGGPVEEASSLFGAYLEAVSGEGTYYDYLDSTRIEEDRLLAIASRAGARAVETARARRLEGSFRGQVVFEPSQAGEVLEVLIEPALSAEAVIEGRSPLAGRLGEPVLNPSLTLVDDPHRPWRPSSGLFDAEGHPTARRLLFEAGTLKAYLHTYYTSRRLPQGGGPGNASRRSPWGRPSPSASTLVLESATTRPRVEDLIAEVDRGVVATANIGLWMSRPESGRLTATITHGYLVERGSVVAPVKGVSLMADVYEVLGRGFIAASQTIECRGSACTPAILVDGATLAG
jgi:PmbA protein